MLILGRRHVRFRPHFLALFVFLALGLGSAQTLVIGQPAGMGKWDPHDDIPTHVVNIKKNLYETLTMRDDDMQLAPLLAESWEIVSDDTWRFYLRDGVQFHNGNRFDAEDVKFSLERAMLPEMQCASFIGTIDKIEIVDALTVDIITKAPDPVLPARLSFCAFIVPSDTFQELGIDGFSQHPVGTGMFVFDSWERDTHVTMNRNENYWGTPARVGQIVFRDIPENFTRVAALESGEIDIATAIPPDAVNQIESNPALSLQSVRSGRIHFFILNDKFPPLDNQLVRQALNYAVDVPAMISSLFGGRAYQLASICGPMWFGCESAVEPYQHDIEKARELLSEAGYPDGFAIDLGIGIGRPAGSELAGQALSFQLAEVGVKVNVQTYEWGTFLDLWRSGQLPMYYFGYGTPILDMDDIFGNYFDPDRRSTWFTASDRVVELGHEAMSTLDEQERFQLYAEFEVLLKEEAPWIFLWNFDDLYGVNSKVQGFVPRADETMNLSGASIAD